MKCPKCGEKTRVIEVVNNSDDLEVYRQRRCPSCGYLMYTTESVTVWSSDFDERWHKYYRRKKKRYERKN